jgi:streptogramin lyase
MGLERTPLKALRGLPVVLVLAAVAVTSSAARQQATSGGCGHAGIGTVAKPSKPGYLACSTFRVGKTLFKGEGLESRGGQITFSSSDRKAPALTCNMPKGASATLYPAVKTGSAVPTVLSVESGSVSCWATAGAVAVQAQARQALFIYRGATIRVGASPLRKTRSLKSATAVAATGETLFGMKVTNGKFKVLVTKGTVRVGNASSQVPVAAGQQRLLSPTGSSTKLPNFTPSQPPDLGSAFLAVHPNLCEKNIKVPTGQTGNHPQGLAADRDGDLWFTDDTAHSIGLYDHNSNEITDPFEPNTGPGLNLDSVPRFITSDRSGNIWFTDDGPKPAIWMIDATNHTFTPHYMAAGSEPWAIENDPNRNVLWLTDRTSPAIWSFDLNTQQFSRYPVVATSGMNALRHPEGIAVDTRDNEIWFTDDNSLTPSGSPVPDPAIGMLDPASRAITWYRAGLVPGSLPRGIAIGPDGNPWFTDERTATTNHDYASGGGDGLIGTVQRTSGKITEYAISANGGNPQSEPHGLAKDNNGNLWFTDAGTTPSIGWINPLTGATIEHRLVDTNGNKEYPMGILSRPDGLWFAVQLPEAKIATLFPNRSGACPHA